MQTALFKNCQVETPLREKVLHIKNASKELKETGTETLKKKINRQKRYFKRMNEAKEKETLKKDK